jgi:hypothetical protein
VHLKLWVRLKRDQPPIEALFFSYLPAHGRLPENGARVRLVYQLAVNEFRDVRRLQLLVSNLTLVDSPG